MADKTIHVKDSPIPASPVLPAQLDETHVFNFRCYKGIDCFNACCRSIDIMLTPYDILRLKQHLGMSSSEFLREYTVPFEFGNNSIAGVKLMTKEGSMECKFVTDEGCSVYEDRPTACRYYPIGLLSLRRADENFDRASYALVQEDHCHGHREDRPVSIADYRKEQGLEEYDEQGRSWRQLILKMKSAVRPSAPLQRPVCGSSSWPATTSTVSANLSGAKDFRRPTTWMRRRCSRCTLTTLPCCGSATG